MIRRVLKMYPTLLRVGLAEVIAYRAEYAVWMLSMTLPLVMLAIWSAVARDGAVGHFDSASFTSYYIATLIIRQLTGAWVVWELIRDVKEGTLAMYLLRPVHPLVAYSAGSLAGIPMRASFVVPILIAGVFFVAPEHRIQDPAMAGLAVASVIGAWMLNYAISVMIGTMAMVIESSVAVWELYLGMFFLLSGYLVPLDLFPPAIGKIARALPFAYTQSVPVEILTNTFSHERALHAIQIQFSYVAVATVCMLFFWQRAVKRFAAFGG